MTDEQQLDISMVYGCMFALSMCADYTDGIQPILASKGLKNLHSKVIFLEKDITTVLNSLQHEFMKSMGKQEQEIFLKSFELFKETSYAILGLDPDQQDRVFKLAVKLKKERP